MAENKVTSDFKIVLIGGSAGSLEALMKILPNFTKLNSFALVIILHRKNAEDSTLEELIAVKTKVPVKEVEDKTELRPGYIYIAPSDYHLLFEKGGFLSLDISEKVNFSRPSIDVSFESAADAFKSKVLGVLLSGANSDGSAGLNAIRKEGGTTIVQEPKTAEIPFMPQHAITHSNPDFIFSPAEITAFLASVN